MNYYKKLFYTSYLGNFRLLGVNVDASHLLMAATQPLIYKYAEGGRDF
jgi:hypothetical protein